MNDLSKAINDLYDLDHRFDIGKVQIRFLLGAMIEKTGTKYGEGTIDKIAEDYNISATTLREARAFASKLNCSPKKLKGWIDSKISQTGRVYWKDVQEYVRAGSDPRVLGHEAMFKRLVRRVENVAQDAEVLAEQLNSLPDNVKQEHQGVMNVLYENIKVVQNQYQNVSKLGKTIIPRSEEYLKFVRGFPCAITGEYPVEAHHALGMKGTSKKSSDFSAIPLSSDLHKELHDLGHETFQEMYRITLSELALNYVHKFLTNQWITQNLGDNEI
jgi:archaellum component FlaC